MAKPSKQIKSDHLDFFISYFQRGIQLGKIFVDLDNDILKKLSDEFERSVKLICVEDKHLALQSWVNVYLSEIQWKRFMQAYQQKKHNERKNKTVIRVHGATHEKLVQCAKYKNETFDSLLNRLVNTELSHQAYLEKQRIKKEEEAEKSKQILTCNDRNIGKIFQNSIQKTKDYGFDMYYTCEGIEKFRKQLVEADSKVIKFDESKIVQSKEINLTRRAGIYYGSDIASYVDECFGTAHVFLSRHLFNEHRIIFGGMATNVEASYRSFRLLLRLIRCDRKDYGSTLSNRLAAKNRKKRLDNFVMDWVRDLGSPEGKIELSYDNYRKIEEYLSNYWNIKHVS
ncbi:hypothetical protein L3V82_08360 [Thiotrichales bacterium 19S3-7]|nr:hypothetical protein [Thiotrichales bacterium 19S3-7]MCF6802268.1 hypothetical protein [Thiotrichales bacterium 19S3-11]